MFNKVKAAKATLASLFLMACVQAHATLPAALTTALSAAEDDAESVLAIVIPIVVFITVGWWGIDIFRKSMAKAK